MDESKNYHLDPMAIVKRSAELKDTFRAANNDSQDDKLVQQ